MNLAFVLMEFRKGSDRLVRDIPLPKLTLQRAQELFGMDSSELFYGCFPVSTPIARELQSFTATMLDIRAMDYFLERRQDGVEP